jgi:hypothetical protein
VPLNITYWAEEEEEAMGIAVSDGTSFCKLADSVTFSPFCALGISTVLAAPMTV